MDDLKSFAWRTSGDSRRNSRITSLVAGAIDGHAERRGTALVDRLQRVVWKSVNMMTYDHEVRDDAFAATWLRLAERLDTIREPEKLPGWLATTACNEVRQILRQRGRQQTMHDDDVGGSPASGVGELLDTLAGDDGEHAKGMMLDESRRARARRLRPARRAVPRDHHRAGAGRPAGAVRRSQRTARPPDRFARSVTPALPQKMKSLLEGDATDPPIDHRGAS